MAREAAAAKLHPPPLTPGSDQVAIYDCQLLIPASNTYKYRHTKTFYQLWESGYTRFRTRHHLHEMMSICIHIHDLCLHLYAIHIVHGIRSHSGACSGPRNPAQRIKGLAQGWAMIADNMYLSHTSG